MRRFLSRAINRAVSLLLIFSLALLAALSSSLSASSFGNGSTYQAPAAALSDTCHESPATPDHQLPSISHDCCLPGVTCVISDEFLVARAPGRSVMIGALPSLALTSRATDIFRPPRHNA